MEEYIEQVLRSVSLSPAFRVRRPTMADMKAVAQLMSDSEEAERGMPGNHEEDLNAFWQMPDFNLAEDAFLICVEPDEPGNPEEIAGYEELYNRSRHAQLDGDGYVHPAYRGMGVGTTLLRLLEGRARQHLALAEPHLRVYVRNGLSLLDQEGCKLHENEGYQAVRYYYHMSIRFSSPPAQPEWPAEIEMRTFQPGDDERQVFTAIEDGFRDHWGFTPWNFEHWRARMVETDSFDPSLWFLLWDGDQLAGGALARLRQGIGWVSQLAVRQAWRRRGLGLALLYQAFGEFFRRGITQVELSVDASNPTGATRLYERAGMRAAREYVIYEKELRPGLEPGEREPGGDPEQLAVI